MSNSVSPSVRCEGIEAPIANNVVHIVGWWHGLLDDLHIKVPRGLCGESLAGEDSPEGEEVPCPGCWQINGGPATGRRVPARQYAPLIGPPR
ncbi:hypothetical protein [Mycobacteroides chelonae]|uniref:hypothetical protein n=1 Tax=Mycobacteroides chelonae TaxID=1774 RepID=UPI000A9725EC|nr:hypothetical protein [Mycobacteroides chelonae]